MDLGPLDTVLPHKLVKAPSARTKMRTLAECLAPSFELAAPIMIKGDQFFSIPALSVAMS